MYKLFLIILIISFFSCSKQEVRKNMPKAQKGVLDLRKWDFNEDGLINMDGEWEFYWKQLLSPDDLSEPEKLIQKEFIQVPKSWKGKVINSEKIDQFGYATYRLKVLLNDKSPAEYSFSVLYIPTACSIFVNGKLISKHGVVGTTNDATKPGFVNKIIDFDAKTDSLDIVIQISNFQFNKAGLAYNIQLGEISESNRTRTSKLGFELFFIGALMIMVIFFIGFYIYRPIDKSLLYFGILSLLIGIYYFFVGLPHLMLFNDLSFNFQTNIIRYTSYLFPLLLLLFFKEVFPEEHKKWSIYLLGYPGIVLAVLTLILPIPISSPFIVIYRYWLVLGLMYLIYITVKAVINKREGSKILLTGYLFLSVFFMNDILFHTGVIKSSNLADIGMFIFIASLSYYLSAKFAKTFNKSENLAQQLNLVNENLGNSIKQGILEISQQKEEIVTQAEQLKNTNEKLIELDRLKESLIYMIVHDLKNPLNVIHSLPDILSPGDDIKLIKRAGSQMLNLVTNILDVQKYEGSEMELKLEGQVLFDIVNESINQTKYLRSDKGIFFKTNVDENIKVLADRTILERVFVNLITNAIKFTPKNGEVHIDAQVENNKMIKVSVVDTGVGISPEILDAIFNKFVQAIAKKSGVARSTGLGLTFCKLAVEAHNGKIWAESPNNEGAIFYFTLPVSEI